MIILPYGHVLLIASKLNASVCSISSGRGVLKEEEEKLKLTLPTGFCCWLFVFLQNHLLPKVLIGIPSECQPVWIQIRPGISRA